MTQSGFRRDWYYSWFWTPYYVAQHDAQEKSGLILPGDHRWKVESQNDCALTHFSSFYPDGSVRSWLWLFADHKEPLKLRLLPEFCNGPEMELIQATIPNTEEGRAKLAMVDSISLELLLELEPVMMAQGITEIWFGFSSKKFVQDRRLRLSAEIMSLEEFFAGLRRKVF